MAGATGSWVGIHEAVAAFGRMEARVDVATKGNVIQIGAEVESRAKRNFEGSHKRSQPRVPNDANKPNIVTGTLRRSIRQTPIAPIASGYTTMVGPTTVYGRRVEMGFKGTDSLGRNYNQPPYPYFGPAVKEVRVRAHEIAVTNWAAAIVG